MRKCARKKKTVLRIVSLSLPSVKQSARERKGRVDLMVPLICNCKASQEGVHLVK